jgi:hypothetical protein
VEEALSKDESLHRKVASTLREMVRVTADLDGQCEEALKV